MAAGFSEGPTPWWQLPEYSRNVPNLESSAPPGYTYDKVKMAYVKTPTQLGTEANQFATAANPSLAALTSQLLSGSGLGGGGSTGALGVSGGGTATGSGAGYSPSGGGINTGAAIPGVELPDQTAATAARYATARDKVGQESRASIDALRNELGATGALGGGAEFQGVQNVIQSGAGELGQVNRGEAEKQADLAADFAKTRYGGAITQRGQDIAAKEAEARLATERQLQESQQSFQQAQLKSQQQMQMLSLALGGLKSLY